MYFHRPEDQGDKGEKGDKGDQGEKGEEGDKGEKGDKGEGIVTCGPFEANENITIGGLVKLVNVDGVAEVRNIHPAGTYEWARRAGGMLDDSGLGISTDCQGNVYVTGLFQGTATFENVPADVSPITLTSAGNSDIFVAKMNSSGRWLWARQASGIGFETGFAISASCNGNVYVTGRFQLTVTFVNVPPDIPPITLTAIPSMVVSSDIFVAKIDSDGNWIWARQAGGISTDFGQGIIVDCDENIYVTGFFSVAATFVNVPPDMPPIMLTSEGDRDIFVAKLDANGTWIWARQAGGTFNDEGLGITADCQGNIYVTGYFIDEATFVNVPPDVPQITLTSLSRDAFVAKINSNGVWIWARQTNGDGAQDAEGFGISTDCIGNIYVTGPFLNSITFVNVPADPVPITLTSTTPNLYDVFVAKINSNGTWIWARQAGSIEDDAGFGIATDCRGDSYVTGFFMDTITFVNNPPTFPPITLTHDGANGDLFVAKINANGTWIWARQGSGPAEEGGNAISVDCQGNIYVAGAFEATVTFINPSPTIPNPVLTSVGQFDIFVTKLSDDITTNLVGIAPESVTAGELINPVFPGISSGPVFTDLLPGYDYGRNNNGELVVICKCEKCADPQLRYFGTAGSTNCMIINPCNCP